MMIETAILALYLVMAMAGRKKTKSEPIFGQMTLNQTLALEYLKSKTEGYVRRATRILWLTPLEAQSMGYAVPDWVVKNYEKFEWSAILFDESSDVLPLYVYQRSALAALEAKLSSLEADGATITQDNPRLMTVDLGETPLNVKFWRNEKGGQYAKYHMEVTE